LGAVKHRDATTDEARDFRSSGGASNPPPYISPKQLAQRWCCSRASVDRIARRAGFTKVCLGEGRNGMVRYVTEEVDAYERERRVRMI